MIEWLDWIIQWTLRVGFLTGFAVIAIILFCFIAALLNGSTEMLLDHNGKKYVWRRKS